MNEKDQSIQPGEWESFETAVRELPISPLAKARTFGEYLRLKCAERKLTMKELADRSKLHPSTIRRFSHNPWDRRASTFRKVVAALEIPHYEQNDIFEKFWPPENS